MRDPRLDKLADVLVGYSTRVKKGDVVAIVAEPAAKPLVEAVYQSTLRAGGHPYWMTRSESLDGILFRHGTSEQIQSVDPFEMHMMRTADVRIALWAEENTKAFGRIDPARLAMHQAARKPILGVFMERAAKGELRWCGTQYPTAASAQDAEMSLDEYADFVFKAGKLDLSDPVAAWRALHERQERVREALQRCTSVRFFVPGHDGHDGTDLRVDVSPPSVWVNCAGHENFPDGEVFTGPQGADGHVNYTFPAVYQGREVEGVRLVFKGGRVVDASAKKNEEFLVKMLDQDAGARTMGEIAIGTNYSIKDFSKNTLFDEKIGGTFHAAVGAGYPESGSSNESGLHWDMVCDLRGLSGKPGGVIEADGKVISRDGKFVDAGWPGE
ncbi:MAG: aminopeptidase [Phycisphaerae bacterium]|nr:aminopeptidase [Phycisphaerae bacterium]